MSSIRLLARSGHPAVAIACTFALFLTGCAGTAPEPECPDIAGTFLNKAEDSAERLTAVLLVEPALTQSSSSVSISADADYRHLDLTAGERSVALNRGTDFICNTHGLRLVKPIEQKLDLGEVLVHDIKAFHTFRKAADGSLVATIGSKEHATIGGIPLSAPEREAGSIRWRPVVPATHR